MVGAKSKLFVETNKRALELHVLQLQLPPTRLGVRQYQLALKSKEEELANLLGMLLSHQESWVLNANVARTVLLW